MKKHLLFFILFICSITNAQIKATITESSNNSPIPYVNIWIENENIGATSNMSGLFEITTDTTNKNIVFSALGFETLIIPASEIKDNVTLVNSAEELDEILLTKRKNDKTTVIGKFKKGKVNHYMVGSNIAPWIIARYFPYKEEYEETPFLKQLEFVSSTRFHKSESKKGTVNIRLYHVNNNGYPGNPLYEENIITPYDHGKKIIKYDFSKLNIKIPKKGVFIGIEWLLTPENYFEINTKTEGEKGLKKWHGYNPSIGTIGMDTDEYSFVLKRGEWQKIWQNKHTTMKRYKGKYNTPAMKLHLSN